MEQAQKIQFNEILNHDVLIIKINEYFTPVQVVERTARGVWYRRFQFHKLEYEGEDQHAHYKPTLEFGPTQRLLKKDHKDIFQMIINQNVMHLEHKANTRLYKIHGEAPMQPPNA
jgi:hypothetical protein